MLKKIGQSFLALAALVVLSTLAHAVWDSTLGNMPSSYQLCWGLNSTACLYGNTQGSNYVRIQTGGTDALTINGSQLVTVPGNLGVTGTTTLTGNVTASGTLAVTGATTFTTNLSSFTVGNATGTYTQTALNNCVAQSTRTLNLPSQISTIWVSYVGASSVTVTGSTITVGILIDGAYVTVAGVSETASRGILSVGNGVAVGGNDVNIGFSAVPVTSLGAGAHNICLTAASTSGALTIDSVNEISAFTAYYLP